MRIQIALLLLLCFGCAVNKSDNPKMKSVFNGKNFENWIEPENNIWWTVNDGILHVKNGPDKKGSILWTEEEFEDFVVQLDFKMGDGTVDSGIFMRGDGADAPQIQIGESGSLKRDMTASPYVPKQSYPVEAEGIKDILKPKDWNTMKAQAIGNVYTVWLNGKKVMTYTMENAKLKGPIGLQLHPSREMSISFKNISVARL
ncbi:3-keto-disaccharide hydrolase [Flavilitoribacter nigricans]|uniref:3-keto-alpha-glucoside-1,2-lyase/3-keto-2-hydroxy-glucal hydratase domain-containing protein n=1 Tax=Flavilitoribacter nigricans (strain ATCC 23147 / DSM 23189 / NBRC 102662 / NCIMB 1420 / SS-2) TaxID=1122177 RepID=A0A2D0N2P9_FLAN2|nr:DUF1080 domain-containing protein [Flavilitoribacter nigricans]PHN02784.1 hypothetical protein CRP01_29825 [Flavilitoribacter nigricans DSM 23189 = NBRC 102662]